jgi:hypothetical protein
MNVKPGEMAKIVQPHLRHGGIVEVVRAGALSEIAALVAHDPSWRVCGHVWFCRLMTGSKSIDIETGHQSYVYPGDDCWIADIYLRPIRGAGDDEADDTLLELPVPGKAVTA